VSLPDSISVDNTSPLLGEGAGLPTPYVADLGVPISNQFILQPKKLPDRRPPQLLVGDPLSSMPTMSTEATSEPSFQLVPWVISAAGGGDQGTPGEGVARPKPVAEEFLDCLVARLKLQVFELVQHEPHADPMLVAIKPSFPAGSYAETRGSPDMIPPLRGLSSLSSFQSGDTDQNM
jgi:hypothetical protein